MEPLSSMVKLQRWLFNTTGSRCLSCSVTAWVNFSNTARSDSPSPPRQYIHHRLIHLTPADYDDFVNIIRSARGAFCLTPVGVMQFNDVLQSLKRGKQTKELWQRISLEMATFSP